MHLVDCGVPLEYIRDLFGYSDAKTTQIYARANLEMKKRALEKAGQTGPISPLPPRPPERQSIQNLMRSWSSLTGSMLAGDRMDGAGSSLIPPGVLEVP